MGSAVAQRLPDEFVFVEGGEFAHPHSNYAGRGVTISSFRLGRHEVTQEQWEAVMGSNPSQAKGADLPVETVSWYDCVEYCNRRSAKEGLAPCYTIDRAGKDPDNDCDDDPQKWTVIFDSRANGYRLPTEAEWEFAASGGRKSRGFTYAGRNAIGVVAWFWQNSGDQPLAGSWHWPMLQQNRNRPHSVGTKAPNELGLHDLSGNVREWCWDWIGDLPTGAKDPRGNPRGPARVWRGGGWIGGDFCCEITFRGAYEPNGVGADQGFRVCRNP